MAGTSFDRADREGVAIEDFDPLRPEHSANPFPWFARARDAAPVFYLPRYDMWVVTRHADCLAVLRDPETFSNVGAMDVRVGPPPEVACQVARDYAFPIASDSLTVVDPPRHTRGRKALQPAMSLSSVNRRADEIVAIADRLIDGFINDGSVELMQAYAFRLPIEVFSPLLGIPVEGTAALLEWADDWFRIVGSSELPRDEAIARWTGLLDWEAWTRELIDKRRETPGNDVVSHLVHARAPDGSAALTDEEIVGNVCNLIAGGVDTTAYLIGQLVLELLRGQHWSEVRRDRSLIPSAVEECMRLLGPVRSVRRRATRDVELGGVRVPAGAEIWVALHSANRDESAFEDPDRFDPRRETASRGGGFGQLGFGNGVHFCIGAPLARVEARIAIEQLVERIPTMRLVAEPTASDYAVSFLLPGLRRLMLAWAP